jgi:hypothetical protein
MLYVPPATDCQALLFPPPPDRRLQEAVRLAGEAQTILDDIYTLAPSASRFAEVQAIKRSIGWIAFRLRERIRRSGGR